ncbi:glutathione peroxidase [Ceratobasidium sp. AG-Ba]|nr:glutathione peroxidase [Ceratobasidium sp. AG-Ba]
MSTFYDLKGEYNFDQLKGKVVLVVNVASKCGFTPQYTALEALYKNEQVAEFCQLNHGVTFPLVEKSDVNGDDANEVYKYLKNEKAGVLGLTRIKWNFEKFLIDREGKVVGRWASTTKPESLEADIEQLL